MHAKIKTIKTIKLLSFNVIFLACVAAKVMWRKFG